ncbi:MAG: class I SAM-dependent methyltransferase [Acidobacteria bacterium]|nr:class I SAM-dependent methyltransferase [Acidobacteriota bacterium]
MLNPWEAGNFARIAPSSTIAGELLCDEIPLHAGQRVLDIGCGSGNTAIAAARRRAIVMGIDPVPFLLNEARNRADADRLDVEWRQGVGEFLPFPDASFDIATSTFGMIFSLQPAQAVSEAARVLVPSGRLVFTSWTEGGLNDQLIACCQAALPDLAMLPIARKWGREADARKWLSGHFAIVRVVHRQFLVRALDTQKWLTGMKAFLAPVVLAYENLSADAAASLDAKLLALGEQFPKAPNGSFFVRVPYLEFHCEK